MPGEAPVRVVYVINPGGTGRSGFAACLVGRGGVDVVELVLGVRLPYDVPHDVAAAGQQRQHGDHDRLRVDLEVSPERRPGVGEAEAVGTQRHPFLRDVGRDLVLYRAHVDADGHDWAGLVAEALGHVRNPGLAIGIHQVPLVAAHGLTTQLVPGRR